MTICNLKEAPSHAKLKIVELQAGESARMRLTALGLHPGDTIIKFQDHRLGPVLVQNISQNATPVAIGKGLAKKIMVSAERSLVALVGQPNCGKSTLFNVLTDSRVPASNFPGTTVAVAEADILHEGLALHLIDLPGTYSLNAGDEAEAVTRDFLLERPVDLIINVLDATLLARSLELTVELMELGLPMLVVLNMQDEVERKGMKLDAGKLEKLLGVPVVPAAAIQGKGATRIMEQALAAVSGSGALPQTPEFTAHVEALVSRIEEKLLDLPAPGLRHTRFFAVKSLENPALLPEPAARLVRAEAEKALNKICQTHKRDGLETIAYERHHLAMTMAEAISTFPRSRAKSLSEKLDRWLLHPLWGIFFLLMFFMVFFAVIYFVGNALGAILDAVLGRIPPLYAPLKNHAPWWWATVDGAFQGLYGALGIVLPYFFPLVLLTTLFEETGYLARIAFLMDGIMHRIGLHGKSVVPFIMGFGCCAPAIYSTRIIEKRRDRILSALLLPFIPCSARHAIIFALTASLAGPLWAVAIYFIVLVVIALVGKGLSVVMGKPAGFLLEIPALKIPYPVQTVRRTIRKLGDFFGAVLPYLIAGSMVLSWLTLLRLGPWINAATAPLLQGILGLPPALGVTLWMGFFRKELIIVMALQALGVTTVSQLPLTPEQVVVFTIFVTFYFPCLSTLVSIFKEFGWRIAILSVILSIAVASVAAFLFKLLLHIP